MSKKKGRFMPFFAVYILIALGLVAALIIVDVNTPTGLATFDVQAADACSTITTSTTITQNIHGNDTCFHITADNVILDGGGFNILGNGSQTGINATNVTNITIKNFGKIENFTVGINATLLIDSIINNNTVEVHNTSTNIGILLLSSNTTNVSNNNIVTTVDDGYGIYLISTLGGLYAYNVINTTGGMARGIYLTVASNQTKLKANNITTTGDNAEGIYSDASFESFMTGNTIVATGSSSIGIYTTAFTPDVSRHNITNNTINTTQDGTGIQLDDHNNNVMSNNITSQGTTGGTGITINSNFNNLEENLILSRIQSLNLNGGLNNSIINGTLTSLTDKEIEVASSSTIGNNFTNVTLRDLSNITTSHITAIKLGYNETSAPADPTNISRLSPHLNIQAGGGESFINLTAYYSDESVDAVNESDIDFYGYNGSEWHRFDNGSVDATTNTVTSGVINDSNLTTFELYAIFGEFTSDCAIITKNITLTTDNTTCFRVFEHNLIIEGNGHSLIANGSSTGIVVKGYDNTTIRNLNISNVTNGINITGALGSRIYNNTITPANGSNSYGILLTLTNNTNITANNITIWSANSSAIVLNQTAENNHVKSNNVTITGTGTKGIHLLHTQKNNITNNNILVNAENATGIYLFDTHNNTIASALINATYNESNTTTHSIYINTSNGTLFDQNTISGGNKFIATNDGTHNNFTLFTFAFANGSVRFNNFQINDSQEINTTKVNITNNVTYVNSTNLTFLNGSGRLTFLDITFTTPRPLVDVGDNSSFATCTDCTEVSFSDNIYVYDVTHFTTFSSEETPPSGTPTVGGSGSGGGGGGGGNTGGGGAPGNTGPSTSQSTASTTTAVTATSGGISCGYAEGATENIAITIAAADIPIPEGFEIVSDTIQANCVGNTLDLTLNLPKEFTNLKALRCKAGECIEETNVGRSSTELQCGGKALRERKIEEQQNKTNILPTELQFVETVEREITEQDNVLETEEYSITFTGNIPPNYRAGIKTPEKPVDIPKSTSLKIIGTPITFSANHKASRVPTTITIPFKELRGITTESIQIYAFVDNTWQVLGGTASEEKISISIDDINQYVNNDNKALFALIGVTCEACTEGVFIKQYDGGSRDALILVHGLFSDATTYESMIEEFTLNKQPWQIWTYSYPTNKFIDDNAAEFADILEQHSAEYDRLFFIGHSLGAMVVQQALQQANKENIPFLNKARQAVLIAGPNEGSPALEAYDNLFTFLANTETTSRILSLDEDVLDELVTGRSIQQVEGIDYVVVAGSRSYDFNSELFSDVDAFDDKNDGIVTIKSAQHIGEEFVDNLCTNYYELNLTHTELNDHPLVTHIISRIVNEDKTSAKPLLGYNQYFRLRVEDCSPDDTYVVIGKKVAEEAVEDPLFCSCGNGICGEGETANNCPIDCAQITLKANICTYLPFIYSPLLIILAFLLAVYVIATLSKQELTHWAQYSLSTLFVIEILLLVIGQFFCGRNMSLLYAIFGVMFAIFMVVYVMEHRRLHKGEHFIKKKPFKKARKPKKITPLRMLRCKLWLKKLLAKKQKPPVQIVAQKKTYFRPNRSQRFSLFLDGLLKKKEKVKKVCLDLAPQRFKTIKPSRHQFKEHLARLKEIAREK